MTQFQFDMICKIIESGSPVLAKELCGTLAALIHSYNETVKENADLKAQLEAINAPTEAAKTID